MLGDCPAAAEDPAGWAKILPCLTPPLFWFQALILVVVLGWVFVPIYIKAGVSICSVILFPADKYTCELGPPGRQKRLYGINGRESLWLGFLSQVLKFLTALGGIKQIHSATTCPSRKPSQAVSFCSVPSEAPPPFMLGVYLQGTSMHLLMVYNCLPLPLEGKLHEKKTHISPPFTCISSSCLLSLQLVLNYQMLAQSLD